MARKWLIAGLIVITLFASMYRPAPRETAQMEPAAAVGQSRHSPAEHALFPDLAPEKISSLVITTPQSTFDFKRTAPTSVSINGRRSDHGAFATLLNQIEAIPYVPGEPAEQQEPPLLTLTVQQDEAHYHARFYRHGNGEELARVVADVPSGELSGTTDGWRVGMLLLACEGTRVQDASGSESPAY